jgi:putative protein-disulfide isomerase
MTHLVYLADPMCSWCWGFAPVIDALAERFSHRAPVRLLMGGLRPYTSEPMRDKDRAFVREHWEHVAERTGQPFDFAFFDRPHFVYDTEPASRAVVTARTLDPGSALAMLKAVQHAFYAENRDVTEAGVLADIAETRGFARAAFATAFESDDAKSATRQDFVTSQNAGIRGFPTLLAGTPDTGYTIVTHGYQTLDALADPLDQWLTRQTAANDA